MTELRAACTGEGKHGRSHIYDMFRFQQHIQSQTRVPPTTRGLHLSLPVTTPSCPWGEAWGQPGRRSMRAGECVHQLQRPARVLEGMANVINVYFSTCECTCARYYQATNQQARRAKGRSLRQTPRCGPGSWFHSL